jgi:beta-glucosidase
VSRAHGADVTELYLIEAVGDERMRLLGFERVELQPGETCSVTLTADPRLLSRYEGDAGQWRIAEGNYQVALGKAADGLVLTAEARLTGRLFGK